MANKELAKLNLSPKEVSTFIDSLDDVSQEKPLQKVPIEYGRNDTKPFKIIGEIIVDIARATPYYRAGALQYGPIDILVEISHFEIVLNWHDIVGIPRNGCIKILDACGEELKVCWDWDFGITRIPFPSFGFGESIEPVILDLNYRKEEDQFVLYGEIAIISAIIEMLTYGLARGTNQAMKRAVKKMLKDALGNGEIARLFIKLIVEVFNIMDLALKVLGDILKIILQPIEELLHELLGDDIEIKLGGELDKKLKILAEENKHSAVFLNLGKEPEINLNKHGLELILYD